MGAVEDGTKKRKPERRRSRIVIAEEQVERNLAEEHEELKTKYAKLEKRNTELAKMVLALERKLNELIDATKQKEGDPGESSEEEKEASDNEAAGEDACKDACEEANATNGKKEEAQKATEAEEDKAESEGSSIVEPPQKKRKRKGQRRGRLDSSTDEEDQDSSTRKNNEQEPPQAPPEKIQHEEKEREPEQGPSNDNPEQNRGVKKTTIPPVVIHKKEAWSKISKDLSTKKINFTKARLISTGVEVTPATPEDHRILTRYLTTQKQEYHTYSLQEEKTARVVIRGIPNGIENKDIEEELKERNFEPKEVVRMNSRRTRTAMPLVLVKLPVDKEEEILKMRHCCSLSVRVERQWLSNDISQCHKCQRFGHAQAKCSAKPRCVRCAGHHLSKDCKRPKEEEAKCVNCGGPHPASYRGCPRTPRRNIRERTPARTPRRQQEPESNRRQTAPPTRPADRAAPQTGRRTFAEAAKTNKGAPTRTAQNPQRPTAPVNHQQILESATVAIQEAMCKAMSAFLQQLPEMLRHA